MNVIRRVCRRLAMDLGYSGWGLHRYEVWIKTPGTELWYWPESSVRKATRGAAIRWAWGMGLPRGGKIELVNLATGKHETIRESIPEPPDVDLERIRVNVLSYIDTVAPGRRFPLPGFRKGYADCRKVVDAAFDRQIRQQQS